jgi:hypothetical protein
MDHPCGGDNHTATRTAFWNNRQPNKKDLGGPARDLFFNVGSFAHRNDRSALVRQHVIPIDLAPLMSRRWTGKGATFQNRI